TDFVAVGGAVSLAAGDSLTLTYQPSTTALADPGSWFAMIGRAAATAFGSKPQHEPGPEIPLSFALRQNQPNPFTARTAIHFDLPVGAMVRLELFDANGRRVETLADRYFPAGYQSVMWDPRGAGKVGPGVYFYRIEAGPFRARRKAVLLP
ncbi:MAG: hypothetical protein HYR73_07350, partial [Candidatus Eisenbacteria bacterium]|nr:hypothetical protein [Candidatus Eisenbacteria bacterium]